MGFEDEGAEVSTYEFGGHIQSTPWIIKNLTHRIDVRFKWTDSSAGLGRVPGTEQVLPDFLAVLIIGKKKLWLHQSSLILTKAVTALWKVVDHFGCFTQHSLGTQRSEMAPCHLQPELWCPWTLRGVGGNSAPHALGPGCQFRGCQPPLF